jgi:DNA-binding transcriptional LysR family regulator
VDLDQVRAFLVLGEELSFVRTAERMCLSPSRVSRLIAALEREIGGALFERSSRRVRLTPLGVAFDTRARPACDALLAARDAAIEQAREVGGDLRIGVTQTTDSPAVFALAQAFNRKYPACTVRVLEIDPVDPYGPLRGGEIDVLCNWLAVDEPDLRTGPVLEVRDRVLLVGRGHRLAGRASVSAEELADERVQRMIVETFPPSILEAIIPARAPSGRLIPTGKDVTSLAEALLEVTAGHCVRPTVTGIPRWTREDVIQVPITGLPPLPLGLIWVTARENATIRALAQVAEAAAATAIRHRPPGARHPMASGR